MHVIISFFKTLGWAPHNSLLNVNTGGKHKFHKCSKTNPGGFILDPQWVGGHMKVVNHSS